MTIPEQITRLDQQATRGPRCGRQRIVAGDSLSDPNP